MTKDEAREYQRIYRLKNKEKARLYQSEYRKRHPTYWKEYHLRGADYIKKYKPKNPHYAKEYYLKNKDKIDSYAREYRKVNGYSKKYYANNREQFKKYYKGKRQTDVQYRIAQNLRARFLIALKRNEKKGSAIRLLGCTISELKIYLEGQFKDGMTWGNYGLLMWHIDHKIPLAFFDLTDGEHLKRACHYTNLQPMWAKENIRKGKRFITV